MATGCCSKNRVKVVWIYWVETTDGEMSWRWLRIGAWKCVDRGLLSDGLRYTLALAITAVVEPWKVRVCWQSLGDASVLAELVRCECVCRALWDASVWAELGRCECVGSWQSLLEGCDYISRALERSTCCYGLIWACPVACDSMKQTYIK